VGKHETVIRSGPVLRGLSRSARLQGKEQQMAGSEFTVHFIDFEFNDLGEFFTIATQSDAAEEWIKNRDKPPGREGKDK
jgi:hypothetical protein